jgi:hypothetical protein
VLPRYPPSGSADAAASISLEPTSALTSFDVASSVVERSGGATSAEDQDTALTSRSGETAVGV